MSDSSNIEWCDASWNCISGCTYVSEGCRHCYSARLTHRLAAMGQTAKYGGLTVLNKAGDRHFNGKVRCHEDALDIPLRWKKPRRIFVNSMSDLFHRDVPFAFVDKVFRVISARPQHTFLVLTKRPERMEKYVTGSVRRPSNVWLGASVEDQASADARIPHLMRCPAAVRWLSVEPMLSPVDIVCGRRTPSPLAPDWVVCGAESGPGARPMELDWARRLRDQCQGYSIPFFMKQIVVNGRKVPFEEWPDDLKVREYP